MVVGADGSFEGRRVTEDEIVTVEGRLDGRASGTVRVVMEIDGARCDSGPVAWTATSG